MFKRNFKMLNYVGKTGAQTIVHLMMKELKAKHFFGYSGGAIMSVFNELQNNKAKCFIGSHEQSCCHAAVGYAKSSNHMGVCISTSGPGVTNMVTPIYDAFCDGIPLLVLTGQVAVNVMGTGAFQECPAVDIMKNVTKYAHCVKDVNELPNVFEKAIKIANTGKKGPVHIDLPKSVLNDVISRKVSHMIYYTEQFDNIDQTYKKINHAIHMIKKSKNPILCVGQGCNEYYDLVRELAFKNKIYVTTTLLGNGIMNETDDYSLKFMGMHGNMATNEIIQKSDCIIGIGYRFDDRTIGNGQLYGLIAKEAFIENRGGIINCNIKSTEFNKSVETNININCNAKTFLTELLKSDLIENEEIRNEREWWNKYILELKEKRKFTYTKTNHLKVQDVLVGINNYLTKNEVDAIISTGVGNHQMMASQFLDWKCPKSFITSGSLGVMGVGLPYAIGAYVANPDKLIIDIDGDSSFNHTLSELKTVKTYDLPIKIAIMNDKSQTMVKMWEQIFYGKECISTDCSFNPKYHDLALSYGIKSLICDNHFDLEHTIETFLSYSGPILCNFMVKGEMCNPFVPPGNALDDYEIRNIKMAPS